jgi:AraC-like DNA-binding protein
MMPCIAGDDVAESSVLAPIPEHAMDGSNISPFPSQSWFGFMHSFGPSPVPTELHLRQVNHLAVLILSGASSNQWIRCGQETPCNSASGMVGFFSADNEEHAMVSRTDTGTKAFILAIPPAHLQSIAASEGLTPSSELQARPFFHDAIIRTLLARLVTDTSVGSITRGLDAEIAARSLVLRLVEITQGEPPDWHADSSLFDSRTMGHITDYIDSHLQHYVPLEELALLCKTSSSHFAKKFRHSAGLSLQRFVNRRRLRAAMAMLEAGSTPLSQIALDLGFSSQSHFTRVFSHLTGFTPASFRRQIGNE